MSKRPQNPRADGWSDEISDTARYIHVEDRDHFTGLYNHLGEPLYRQPERFGFDPNRWKPPHKKRHRRKDDP